MKVKKIKKPIYESVIIDESFAELINQTEDEAIEWEIKRMNQKMDRLRENHTVRYWVEEICKDVTEKLKAHYGRVPVNVNTSISSDNNKELIMNPFDKELIEHMFDKMFNELDIINKVPGTTNIEIYKPSPVRYQGKMMMEGKSYYFPLQIWGNFIEAILDTLFHKIGNKIGAYYHADWDEDIAEDIIDKYFP